MNKVGDHFDKWVAIHLLRLKNLFFFYVCREQLALFFALVFQTLTMFQPFPTRFNQELRWAIIIGSFYLTWVVFYMSFLQKGDVYHFDDIKKHFPNYPNDPKKADIYGNKSITTLIFGGIVWFFFFGLSDLLVGNKQIFLLLYYFLGIIQILPFLMGKTFQDQAKNIGLKTAKAFVVITAVVIVIVGIKHSL